MAENSYYYDGSLCIACRSCQVACKQWNYLPGEKTKFFAAAGGYQNPSDLSPMTWTIMMFHERMIGEQVEWLFRRHHCFHCTEAACIEACPVEPEKAMQRHPEFGTVSANQELCIGCGACVEACPFSVPHVCEQLEKSCKCTGCADRVTNGLITACAKTCPTKAIRYGPKKDIYALAKSRVKELKKAGFPEANVYGTDILGGLHSIYVLPAKLEVYGLPANPTFGSLEPIKRKAKEKFAAWQREHGEKLASVGGSAVVLGLAAAGLKKLADRKTELASEEASEES